MKSEFTNSPEDRLLDELLREQAHGPDEAFLQQIENAVDDGAPLAAKRPAARHYGRFAIAAGLALTAGGFVWSSLQNRHPRATVSATDRKNAEKEKSALELEKLNTAIHYQEDKVEERRKVLATIAAAPASGENVELLPSLIGKLMYVKDESRAWVLRPGFGADGGFPITYEDSSRQTNKRAPAELIGPGDSFFLTGPMANRFKLLGSEVRREISKATKSERDVTIVRIEDQWPNKKGTVYEFPSPLNDQRKNEFLQYDRTAVFSLGATGVEGKEFKVEENTAFSLPPGGEKKDYLLKSITPTGVIVEIVDGGKMVEIRKGAMPADGALSAMAENSAGSPRGHIPEEAIMRGLDAQDYVDAKRDFETDQQLLQGMKLKQAELAARSGYVDGANSAKLERSEIVAGGLNKKTVASSRVDALPPVLGMTVDSKPALPEPESLPEIARLDDMGAGSGLGGSGIGKGFGAGMAAGRSGTGEGSVPKKAPLGSYSRLWNDSPFDTRPAPEALAGNDAMDKNRTAGLARLERENRRFPAEDRFSAPEQTSGDNYGTFIDQPWKTSEKDPLSTFSIDVDTASYSNVRRMIQEGREIPKDAVRIEEFINAFKYHYQAPKGDAPFAVGAALAVCPWAPTHQLARISIKGREIDAGNRPASNLVFLVDVSGSMQSPDKLPLLKQSMETMVSQLDERDRVAIVVYAGSEGVALPSTRVDEEGRAKVLTALSKLEAGGSTNGGAGIKRAYELAMEQKIEGGVNRVILATDGDFNVGVTGKPLVEMVKERAKGGVYLTVAGFGSGNLNDEMMDAITHDGNGNYFYIDSEAEGRKVFLQDLSGTLVTIAKDLKIQVEFNPAKVGGYRLIGYANRVLRNEDFNNDKVDAGDIGAGHTVTAFYELTPPGASSTDDLKYQAAEKPATTNEWLTVKLRYKHPDGNESSKIEFPLAGDPLSLERTDSDFQFAAAVALSGMKLRGNDEAKEVSWDQVITLAKSGLADDAREDRTEFVGLVEKLGHITPSVSKKDPVRNADENMEVDGPNVRVIRHQDGSRSVFVRSPDKRSLVRKTYSANGSLAMVTVYKMDDAGNPLDTRISDARGEEIFRVSYGYHKETGRLVEELMFDSRVKRVSPDTGREMPVQKVVYFYDADGKRSAPVVYNYPPGKTIEELLATLEGFLGLKSTELDRNPFDVTDGNGREGNLGGNPRIVPAPAEVVPGNR
ncbi:MAG: Amuc_1099 family pilus-like system protein [Luteolibacter sp.]|uniref:Amuc_1099 family pilus-like system protein n=1 Tax=Luteolibacter sp. TaxID=1962973 RepID=UPI0032656291